MPEMSEPHKVRPSNRLWIDTETTGLNPVYHEIIEIAILVESVLPDGTGTIVSSWATKISPERIDRADAKALEVNGYTPEAWAGAPRFGEVAPQIAELLASGSLVCGHNVGFDVAFISASFALIGSGSKVRIPYHKLDTVTLAYAAWNGAGTGPGLSLDKLRKHLGIPMEGAHSALKDALDARTVYYEALKALRGAAPPEES
jgi:DNA polymerase III epsilon subunit-like protein